MQKETTKISNKTLRHCEIMKLFSKSFYIAGFTNYIRNR